MLQHVTRVLPAAQLGPCTTFYGLLGFERVPVPTTIAGTVVWLACRGTQIHLMVEEGAVPQAGHIAVVATDYLSTLRRLRDSGYAVEPRQEHWGSPRAFVQDPFGNLVEVMAFAPVQSPAPATMQP
jgi:hypothetical protein